jgi:hypothetical protein
LALKPFNNLQEAFQDLENRLECQINRSDHVQTTAHLLRRTQVRTAVRRLPTSRGPTRLTFNTASVGMRTRRAGVVVRSVGGPPLSLRVYRGLVPPRPATLGPWLPVPTALRKGLPPTRAFSLGGPSFTRRSAKTVDCSPDRGTPPPPPGVDIGSRLWTLFWSCRVPSGVVDIVVW